MPRLSQCYAPGRFGLSIEIFPPKTEKAEQTLRQTLARLTRYDPAFVSCTYGAGGSTRDKTLAWCEEIQNRFDQTATAHFTCVGSDREELLNWLAQADERGVHNIMALRGDPPEGMTTFEAVAGGFSYAAELVALIREHYPEFGIGVAGYPERHPESPDSASDLEHLKAKVDRGADAIFTQLFYINGHFTRFRDACQRSGISVPIVPGIMPITSFARIKRITAMCGSEFPSDLAGRLEAVKDDANAQLEIGVNHAIEQCRELMDEGVPGIHFYVLNQCTAAERILDELGLSPLEATA